jgi:hypothetical protein
VGRDGEFYWTKRDKPSILNPNAPCLFSNPCSQPVIWDSWAWLPNRDQSSYLHAKIGPSVSYWCHLDGRPPGLVRRYFVVSHPKREILHDALPIGPRNGDPHQIPGQTATREGSPHDRPQPARQPSRQRMAGGSTKKTPKNTKKTIKKPIKEIPVWELRNGYHGAPGANPCVGAEERQRATQQPCNQANSHFSPLHRCNHGRAGTAAEHGSRHGGRKEPPHLNRTCRPRYDSYSISTFLNSNGKLCCAVSSPIGDRSRAAPGCTCTRGQTCRRLLCTHARVHAL